MLSQVDLFIDFSVFTFIFAIKFIDKNVIDSANKVPPHTPFTPNIFDNNIKPTGKNTIDLNKQIVFEYLGISIAW